MASLRLDNPRALFRTALSTLALLGLVSCAASPNAPLDARILPEEKRYEFLKAQGSDMPPEIRNAFIDGQVIRGMPREWVLELYGRPDGLPENGWEYRDGRGKPVLALIFEQDAVDSIVIAVRTEKADSENPQASLR